MSLIMRNCWRELREPHWKPLLYMLTQTLQQISEGFIFSIISKLQVQYMQMYIDRQIGVYCIIIQSIEDCPQNFVTKSFSRCSVKKINISLPGSCYWRIKKLENKSQFQKLYSNYSMQKYIYSYQVQIVDRNGLIMNVIK